LGATGRVDAAALLHRLTTEHLMRREPAWTENPGGRVVHLVGAVSDDVFRFLARATHTLAGAGVEQSVVMIDHLRHRQHLTSFHANVDLVFSPAHRNPMTRWREMAQAFRRVLAAGPPRVVHLHGLLPCLLGAYVVRRESVTAPVFYSPHGVRLASLLAAARSDVTAPRPPMDLVESPVTGAFFDVPRNEARHALVVTASRAQDARSSESFAQLAVLIGGEDLRIAFNWIGPADPVSRTRLNAAGVGVFDTADDAERASRLAAGWVYVALVNGRGFPLFLVEAMAAGLPCVAIDSARHRDVIRSGETGYLFSSQTELLEHVARLIDAPALRQQIGDAAREEARRRFSELKFHDRLLAAYELARP
jgi:hypothetical protein